MTRRIALFSTAVLALSLGLAGCSGNDDTKATAAATVSASAAASVPAPTASPKYGDEPTAATATEPCGAKTVLNAAAASALPKAFPVVTGWQASSTVTQGKTVAVSGFVTGAPAAITVVRDEAFTKIIAAGYTKTGSDEEPGFEADGDFTGPVAGNLNVKTLCQGNLLVTYTFNQ